MERNDAVTIGRKLSSLRAFFRLAVRRRLVRGSPVAALRAPKRAKRLPAFLGKEDVGRLLDGERPRPDAGRRPAGARARAVRGDLRRRACASRRRAAWTSATSRSTARARYVRVRQGKGRKDRIVPLGGKARAALDAYAPLRATRSLAARRAGAGRETPAPRCSSPAAGCASARAPCAGCSPAASR